MERYRRRWDVTCTHITCYGGITTMSNNLVCCLGNKLYLLKGIEAVVSY